MSVHTDTYVDQFCAICNQSIRLTVGFSLWIYVLASLLNMYCRKLLRVWYSICTGCIFN